MPKSISIQPNRVVIVETAGLKLPLEITKPFVMLVPAYDLVERKQIEAIVISLINLGCIEICCVGPEATALHEALDTIMIDCNAEHVITTSDIAEAEVIDYFLWTAGENPSSLLALVSSHPELITAIETAVSLPRS